MRFSKRSGRTVPMRQNIDSHNSSEACQWFLPCNGVVGGNLLESKQGCIVQPQSGATFEYDAGNYSVRSTALGTVAPSLFASGTIPPLTANKKALFMHAGYVSFPDGAPAKTMRVALGDVNNTLSLGKYGWGLSDGVSSGLVGHTLIYNSTIGNGSYYESGGIQTPMGELIETSVGVGGYFYRYAIYDPTVLLQEVAVRNATTGAVIYANNTEATAVMDVGAIQFVPAFRCHGVSLTGVGLWYFDTVPSDIQLAMLTMANYWRDGDKVVWPWA